MMIKSTILIVLSLSVFQFTAFSQQKKEYDVPKIVRDSVKKKYPEVYVYEWEWKKKKNLYQTEFIMKGCEYEADFTKEGVWVKTERDISKNDVPATIWESLNQSQYSTWKIEDIEEHSTPKYKQVYALELTSNKNKIVICFLANGTITEIINQ